MRILKNKKGFEVFLLGMVLVFIILTTYTTLQIIKRQNETKEQDKETTGGVYVLGNTGISFIETTHELEEHLFYLDQKSKLEIYNSINQLGMYGGFTGISGCGTYDTYNKWSNNAQECYPDYKLNLAEIAKTILASVNSNPVLPTKFSLKIGTEGNKTKVSGETSEFIILAKGTYKYMPSFEYLVDYKLTYYGLLIAKSKLINETCKFELNLTACVKETIKDMQMLSLAADPNPDDRILKFDAVSENKILVHDTATNTVQLKPVTIRFALEIPFEAKPELMELQP